MRFQVKAFRDKSSIASLAVEAVSAEEATRVVQRQGYAVLGVDAGAGWSLGLPSRTVRFPLLLFSQELHVLLEAGLSLIEAMETLGEKESHAQTREGLAEIGRHLYEGRAFSYALEQALAVFPILYIAMVRAAERTGDLPQALTRFVAYQTQIEQVRKKIVNASIYPALLLIVGGLVVIFLMAYVVPRFSGVYESTGRDLPWLSRLLLEWGSLMRTNAVNVMVAGGALCLALMLGLSRSNVRVWIEIGRASCRERG